ncbi:hypothetical protein CGRA01v4_07741 [Colletotrichum graminicola]|uniref:Zn(2)-C6 fungal-type domain-containing protein n=1 Tax=Colletotrichum graminicola (strain M1.001 / M2 / FGSC 10212) TaxID=645133 RepID=E3QPN9_COLGM|nr:uncharacterized protein GLRG_07960 [Colletotrichum graminicola M1.001]EFQ32816.1 hypothetical protein GLRG_07960 [Colletotrichum graminicola M1.001]WDK16458.1 hypothetical protein CGRA01v4_07741 [Colletotrichum graminicola]
MNPLRPLRPRPVPAAGSPINDQSADVSRLGVHRAPRQRKTNSACDPCRKRKTKCDGKLPRCLMCEHRAEACAYTYSIRHRVTVTEGEDSRGRGSSEMLDSLRTLPHEQALELFSKLRNEPSSPSLLVSALSEKSYPRRLLPPSQKSLSFELNLRYPIAYPTLFPVSYKDLPRGEMLKSISTPWLLGEQILSPGQDLQPKYPYMIPDREDEESGPEAASPALDDDDDPPSTLFDERLRLVDISKWTPVAIPNDLAIHTISHYFENDYATIPLFSADLFIQDLVNVQCSFCSPFLITAILCWACQAFTPLHPDAAAYSVAFFTQAQQHFLEQPQANSLTTIAALQILGMCAATYGKDDMSLQLLQESARLCRLMGLFDVTRQSESAEMWLGNHEDWARTASYTAWGVYNWVSVYSLHYHIFEITTPPLLPKPRDLVSALPANSSTALHAEVVSASSDMWVTFNVVVRSLYSARDHTPSQEAPLKLAEETYHRLLQWTSGLPTQLARAEEMGHNVMMMHIYFHAIITDLFRPFLDSSLGSERLSSFSTELATPEAVYTASVEQLKRLLLLYRLRYRHASFSVLWQTAIIYVANAMIREAGVAAQDPDAAPPSEQEWGFYLDLCLVGLEDLYVSFRVFGPIAQGIMSMALRNAAIPAEKAARVLRQLGKIEKQHNASQGMADKAETRCIVDLDLALTDPEAAQGQNLVEQLAELMLDEMGPHAEREGSGS